MISMWHEARKQERKIRGMLVDYKKRAERRREYYERIKQDPTQFIQLHGRACKIHLDPAVHFAAEAPGSMMPWRGDKESMIDRFDVRAHLDEIPSFNTNESISTTSEEIWEERQVNYERYRIIVQNDFLGIKEEKFLNQIRVDELYGPVGNRAIEEEKKALAPKKAAIGFDYSTEGDPNAVQNWSLPPPPLPPSQSVEDDDDSGDNSDSDIDLDLTVDVLSLTNEQQMELNNAGVEFGLTKNDFMNLISRDLEEAEVLRVAKEHEDEKAMFSGRKSRKERRALKKKHLDKKMSPPSYAARASPTYGSYQRLSSKSKSPSPPCITSHVKFITSFADDSEGGTSDDGRGVIIIPVGGAKKDHQRSSASKRSRRKTSSSSRERSRSISKGRGSSSRRKRSRSSSRCRSTSWSPRRDRSRSSYKARRRSRSYSRSKRRSDSYSRSPDRSSRRSHYGRSRYYRASRSRSYTPPRSKSPVTRNSSKVGKSQNGQELTKSTSSPKIPSPPRRRYYGRREEKTESDSPLEEEEPISSEQIVQKSAPAGNETSVDKSTPGSKLTPKERLRKKMQALLKKQYKADKKLEKLKQVKAEQERQDREEELRGIAIKLRRREREKRHRMHGDDSQSEDSSDSRSASLSKSDKSIDSPPARDRDLATEVRNYSLPKDRFSESGDRDETKDSTNNRDKYKDEPRNYHGRYKEENSYRDGRYKEENSYRDGRCKEENSYRDDRYKETTSYIYDRYRERYGDSYREDRHTGYKEDSYRYDNQDSHNRDNRYVDYKEDSYHHRSGHRDSGQSPYSHHFSRSRDQSNNREDLDKDTDDYESNNTVRLVDY